MTRSEPGRHGVVAFPAEFQERYRREGWWRGEVLGDLLRSTADRTPERVALVGGPEPLTYGELDRLVDRLGLRLLKLGLRSGDRLVVQLPNDPAFVVLVFALFRIGVCPVFALPPHREHEIGYLCRHSGAVAYAIPSSYRDFDHQALARTVLASCPSLRHVLVLGEGSDGDFTSLDELIHAEPDVDPSSAREAVEALRPDPGDVALFLLSGGTTGLPKLIPRTHDDYAYNIRACVELCGFDSDTVYLVALPAGHNFPLGCPGILGTLSAGGGVLMIENPNPKVAFAAIAGQRATATALVPALVIRWLAAPEREQHDLSSLNLLQVGGARLNAEVACRVRPLLDCRLQQVFGMAEGLINWTRLDDPDEVIIETQGRPMSPGDEIRIVDADDRPVAAGEPGELLTRGPYTIRGYYDAAETNARAFTADGFYRTGDIVRLHPSGNLVVEGRSKDLINRGGEKISAEEIENLVLGHPQVLNAAAVAMPDPALGERVCLYVIPRAGEAVTLEQLTAYLSGRGIARFKLPERLECVESFPLTDVGKVSKLALREDIARRLSEAS